MNIETPRAIAILNTIASIPEGKLSTYGLIACAAGYPGNARLVGQILKHLPNGSSIPWHRVINAQGQSSFPPHTERHHEQIYRLVEEGHPRALGKKHLQSHSWPTIL